jgi:hypothetical protein
MNPILRAVGLSTGIGLAALILAFIAMMSAPPLPTSVLTAVIYLGAGFWSGRMKIKLFWFAPLLISAPIWIVFIPMGMEIWPPVIHIWYFLVPPGVALVSTYVGLYLSIARHQATTKGAEKDERIR